MNVVEVFKDTVNLAVEQNDGEYFIFGRLSYIIESNGKHIYFLDVDSSRYEQALKLAGAYMFPGFDPENGWRQRHDKEIQFIYERTFNPKRSDLRERLIPWNIDPRDYNKWEFLKISKGVYLDKWRVLPL